MRTTATGKKATFSFTGKHVAWVSTIASNRLRSTWLRDCAEILGLATFMHAAGITCSQRLGDIIADLPPGDEAEAVRLLGGSR